MGTTLDLSLLASMGQPQGFSRDFETNGTGLTQVLSQEKTSLDLNSDQSGETKRDPETSFHSTLDKKLKQDKADSKQEATSPSQDEDEKTDIGEEKIETTPPADWMPMTPVDIVAPESIPVELPEELILIEPMPEILIPEAVVSTELMGDNPVPQMKQAISDALAGQPEMVSPDSLTTNVNTTGTLPTEGMLELVETALNESVPVNAEALTLAVAQAKPDTLNNPEAKNQSLAATATEVETSTLTDSLIAKMEQTQESLESTTSTNTLKAANTESGLSPQETLAPLKELNTQTSQSEVPVLPDPRDQAQAPVTQMTPETIASTWAQGKQETSLDTSEIPSTEVQPSVQPAILTEQPTATETVTSAVMPDAPNPARSVSQQILESVQTSLQTEDKSITINLTPPELGRVTLRFQESADGLKGELELSRQETRYEVERALPQIIQSLQANGIQVRKIEVNVNVGDPQDSDPQQELLDQETRDSQQQQDRWNQQDNLPGGRSAPSDGTSTKTGGAAASGYESSFDTDSIDMLV